MSKTYEAMKKLEEKAVSNKTTSKDTNVKKATPNKTTSKDTSVKKATPNKTTGKSPRI